MCCKVRFGASLVGLALSAWLLPCAGPAFGVVSYQTVALPGDAAPGLAPGTVMRGYFSLPTINNSGEVSFFSATSPTLNDPIDSGTSWAGVPGTLHVVATHWDAAPGEGPGVNLAPGRYEHSINDDGDVSFKTGLIGPNVDGAGDVTDNHGIWSEGGGTLHKVMRLRSQVPGMADGVIFMDLPDPIFNDAGQTMFTSEMSGPGIDDSNRMGMWIDNGGALSLIAQSGDQAPGMAAGTYFGDSPFYFGGLSLNGAGDIAFVSNVSGPSDVNRGIWKGSPGALNLVVKNSDQAPGTETGVMFGSLGIPQLNESGQLAFFGRLTGPGVVDGDNKNGIWSDVNGSLELIVRNGDPAPGTHANVFFTRIKNPAFNDAGQIAFRGSFSGPGYFNDAIWVYEDGEMRRIVTTGETAAGVGPGVVYQSFPDDYRWRDSFQINNAGQIAFTANLEGPGIGANFRGLWVTDTDGVPQLIAQLGDVVDVDDDPVATDLRTIKAIDFEFDLDFYTAGSPRVFNDVGQFAYHLTFTDGTEGLFVATVGLAGDLNSDGFVGIDDLNLVLTHWNQNVTHGDALSGDYSGDGFVGIDDLSSVLGNWNTGTPPASTVPEPGTVLLMIGGVVLTLNRKR